MNLIIPQKIFFCFAMWLFFVGPVFCGESSKITVQEILPDPNYHLCTDKKDIEQLTDGELERYPIWTRKGCVGWNQKGAVAISLTLNQKITEKMSGILRIHTAKGIYAGVKPPARIDVYTKNDDGNFFHVSGKTINSDLVNDRASHWISFDLEHTNPQLLIILHPNGNYLFLDEIQWENRNPLFSDGQIYSFTGDLHACKKDSQERYRKSLLERKQLPLVIEKGWHDAFGKESIKVWVENNPYDYLDVYPSAEKIQSSAKQIELIGTNSELEDACFGVLNNGRTMRSIQIKLVGSPEVIQHIKLAKVDSVLAANGEVVFDPFLLLKTGRKVGLPAKQASYFWLSADLRGMPPGEHKINVLVQEQQSDTFEEIPFVITVVDKKISNNFRPAAVNWAYTNDRPIWNHPQKCLVDLVSHGINIFVIHPANISMPSDDGKWDINKAKKLVKDLELYRGKGKILFFLGWGEKKGRLRIPSLEGVATEKQEIIIQNWIHQLVKFLEDNGISKTDWLIYPIDEPHGAELDFLLKLSKWIKEADAEVQIYANPISTHSDVTTVADLTPLKQLVDIWQPSLNLAERLNDFFKRETKLWWVYAGTGSPAKASSPWENYRLLSWRAWVIGAKGVGFWSYSDTSGTTAWDDFDGRRPDFAVVYEGPNGPISSRRWEAFREGVEDFQLLQSVMHGNLPSGSRLADTLRVRVKELLDSAKVSFADINELRKDMLTETKNFQGGIDN